MRELLPQKRSSLLCAAQEPAFIRIIIPGLQVVQGGQVIKLLLSVEVVATHKLQVSFTR